MSLIIKSIKITPDSHTVMGRRGSAVSARVLYDREVYEILAFDVDFLGLYHNFTIPDKNEWIIWDMFVRQYRVLRRLAGLRRELQRYRRQHDRSPSKNLMWYALHPESYKKEACVVAKHIMLERLNRLIEYTTRPESEWTQKLYARQLRGVDKQNVVFY